MDAIARMRRPRRPTVFDNVNPQENERRILEWRPRCHMRIRELTRSCKRRATITVARTERLANEKTARTGCVGKDFARRLKRKISVIIALVDPYKDLVTVVSMVIRGHPWWAAVNCCFILLAHVVLWYGLNFHSDAEVKDSRRKAFQDCFGCPPFFVLLQPCETYAAVRELFGVATHEQQCYLKIRLLTAGTFEAFPWTLFQCYILWRQTFSSTSGEDHMVNPYLLALGLPLSFFTVAMARQYMKIYSKIAHEGNERAFLDNLLLLGKGMAPPFVLEELRKMRVVTIRADLSGLDYRGLMSIAHAVCTSATLRDVTFDSTGLETSPGVSHCLGTGQPWSIFMDEMTFNRKLLETISFRPRVSVPNRDWSFTYAQRLLEVRNGLELLHSFTLPCTKPLFEAIENDSRKSISNLVNMKDWQDLAAGAKWAASVGHWWSLATILARRPALHLREPLLMCAASEGHEACVRLLIACQADANQDSALYYAATCGSEAGVKALLEAGADPCRPATDPPLNGVSWVDNRNIALKLLHARAELEARGREGCTPLWWCSHRSAPRVAEVLISARADLEAKDPAHGWTPLTVAADLGSLETLNVLIKAGANVLARNKRGRTALEEIEEKLAEDRSPVHGQMVRALMAAADVDCTNNKGGWTRGCSACHPRKLFASVSSGLSSSWSVLRSGCRRQKQ
eukprot:TRINITY_DN38252_c0_g1_i1.p1 TRINITY_DN38252_c0_g1~~TRINITY_DN38252_c0_g1_i1.p1  ORF type:complete len:686 (-),score=75.74 TRINITY_DN38252_c0_g1_i1:50-2107(-)